MIGDVITAREAVTLTAGGIGLGIMLVAAAHGSAVEMGVAALLLFVTMIWHLRFARRKDGAGQGG